MSKYMPVPYRQTWLFSLKLNCLTGSKNVASTTQYVAIMTTNSRRHKHPHPQIARNEIAV